MSRLTGWNGAEVELDKRSAKLLLIVNEAGKSITYKWAAKLGDIYEGKEVVKSGETKGSI